MSTFNFKTLSGPITLTAAGNAHIDYLLNGPHVVTDSGTIVHSLYVNPADLQRLASVGNGGMRLYFCREETGSSPYLNIICVPVDGNMENVLDVPVTGATALVNNLEPCPDRCPGPVTLHQLQCSEKDLNYKINAQGVKVWCKPNLRNLLNNKNWFDATGNPIE